jgi:hypothetical protein
VRQKSRGNEIVRDRLTLGIDIKTKEHNPHDVIEPSDASSGAQRRSRHGSIKRPDTFCQTVVPPPSAACFRQRLPCARPSSPPHASRGWTSPTAQRPRPMGAGRDGSSTSLPSTWHAARCVSRVGCGSSRPSPRSASCKNPATREAGGGPATHCASAARRVCVGLRQPVMWFEGRRAPAAGRLWVRHARIPVCMIPDFGHSRGTPADELRAPASRCHPCQRLTH